MAGPELEALALDLAAHEASRAGHHSLPPGSSCPNCATTLQGPWCHICGQKADDFQRSIWHLVGEAFEGLTHFDSRLWRTLRELVRHPGRLTAEYIEGHRASQLPPFRLFLIMVVAVFFVGNISVGLHPRQDTAPGAAKPAVVRVGPDTTFKVAVAKPGAASRALTLDDKKSKAFDKAVEDWSHNVALLSVLVMAPAVALLFIRRRLYFFDHLIFSLHSLSFQGAVLTLALILRDIGLPRTELTFLAIPVHLFVHLRGAYGLTNGGALWRTAALLFLEMVGFILLMIGLILIALAATR